MLAATDPLLELTAIASAAQEALAPPVLLGYQQRWLDDDAQLKVSEKSRRTGMTWAEACDDVLIASAEGGSNVFYISATQDMAREYIEACALWARAFDAAASEISEGLYDDGGDGDAALDPAKRFIKTYELVFPKTGRRIVALSSRPTNLRGKQGVIVIDEAAFAPDLAGLLKAAMAMLLWGDRVRIISTHNGTENPFNNLVQEVRAGKRGSATVHRITFAEAVADGLYRRVCLRKGKAWTPEGEAKWVAEARAFYGDDAAEELDVIPSASGGKYLSLALISQRMSAVPPPVGPVLIRGQWDDAFAYLAEDVREYAIRGWVDAHVMPHLRALSELRRHVFAQDFARNLDLSVMVVGEEDTDLVHRCKLVIELRNCPFSSQRQIAFAIIDALQGKRFAGGAVDATGNGAAHGEALAQRYGVEMIEQVKLNAAWYLAHMPKLKGAMQDGTFTDIPRDDALRDDLRAIELVQGVPMVPKGSRTASAGAAAAAAEGGEGKNGKRHGDFAVAAVLCEYAFHREVGEMDWTPAPGRTSRWDGGHQGAGRRGMRDTADEDDLAVESDAGAKGAW